MEIIRFSKLLPRELQRSNGLEKKVVQWFASAPRMAFRNFRYRRLNVIACVKLCNYKNIYTWKASFFISNFWISTYVISAGDIKWNGRGKMLITSVPQFPLNFLSVWNFYSHARNTKRLHQKWIIVRYDEGVNRNKCLSIIRNVFTNYFCCSRVLVRKRI